MQLDKPFPMIHITQQSISVFFFMLVAAQPMLSQNSLETYAQRTNMTQFDMNSGLPNNYIDNIQKDSRGFIWMATGGGGLSRFDGYTFRTYDISTNIKLSSNFVHETIEDDFDRLWIASDGGLDILDMRNERMVRNSIWPSDKMSLIETPVHFINSDSNGIIWFVCSNKIYAAECDTDGSILTIAEYVHTAVISTLERVGDDVWCGAGKDVFRLSFEKKHIDTKKIVLPDIDELHGNNYITTALYRKDNDLWIGTDMGLIRIHLISKSYKIYRTVAGSVTSLSQDRITDIVETAAHNIVISTLRGLNIYNPISDNFEQITQETELGLKKLPSNFINCMLPDDDMLWVGTEVCGAMLMIPNELSVKNYTHTDRATSIAPNPVNAIIEDNNGNLWVGNVEGGLSMRRNGSDTFTHYTAERNGLPHNSISALAIDDKNRLWIGTWGNGVCAIDLNSKNVIENTRMLQGSFVGTIVFDKVNKGVWIATTKEVCYVSPDNQQNYLIHDSRMKNMGGAIGGDIDNEGNLWLGTEKGLLIVDLNTLRPDSVRYHIINHRLDDPSQKISPRILFIRKAKNGTMYVGTNGYGLCYKRPDEERFHVINVADGLPNSCVKGIAEDQQGNIWVSTNFGLCLIDTRTYKVATFTTDDGLANNCFYLNAAHTSSLTGNVFFGTLSGLTEVSLRNTTADIRELLSPTLTALRILNVAVDTVCDYISSNIVYANQLRLHERDKSFSIEFSALNCRNPKSVNYQYRLIGFDADWIETRSDARTATYTNLPPGEYELQLCCTDGHGNWSPTKKFAIIVEPFFYKTTWFLLLVIAILGIVVWQLLSFRVRNLKEQRRLLNMLVKERTEELEQQNIVLSEQNVKITQQKNSIEEMSNKIQKLSIDKLQFFTNISHEIRTPITLIIGPIRRAIQMTTDSKIIEQLKLVEKSSSDLLQIVNQLMDFRKIETGNMELKPENGKIIPFVADIVHPFAVYASERNISVESFYHIRTDTMLFDTDALNKVLTNLLSNAVKYTNDCGKVKLFMATIKTSEGEKLYICVRDTGDGIPDNELEKIFESYYQSDNHKKALTYGQSGTGIGLYLCRKIVDQANGKIWARNNKGKGCSMRILLPFVEGVPIVDEERAEQIAEQIDIEEQETEKDGKKSILVVEDNRDMRQYIRTILEDQYRLIEAKNGVEALTLLVENDIDFIICDLMMPVMDGLEFAERVKKNFSFSHIPILVLTAQMSDEYRTKSYKIGVESYLHKPFDEQMLRARISGILEGRRENQQKFQYSLNTDDLNIDRESEDEKFVKQVLALVEKNYKNSDYTIDDILKEMSCSKSMLNKKMQNVVGQSPGVFIRSYRLNMAKQLIIINRQTKNLNISQIAYEVGFNDPKYFTRCFTKYFSVTPSVLMDSNE